MKRRYKLILIIFISFLLTIFIYFTFYKEKYYYLAIGNDYKNFSTYTFVDYINENLKNKKNYKSFIFNKNNYTLESIYEDLVNNKDKINSKIKKANIITLTLNINELNNYKVLNNIVINDYLNNLELIINKIKKLNNNNIYIINLYDQKFNDINIKIKEISTRNNINYIKLDNIKNNYLSYKDHKKIANLVVNNIK
jgi:hypothetical protein